MQCQLSNSKRPQKITEVHDDRIISMIKNNFTTFISIKTKTLEVACVSHLRSTINPSLHEGEYREFTARCKPQVTLGTRKERCQKTSKGSEFYFIFLTNKLVVE